ncbi:MULTISPECIES: response regulator transcription factor [Sporosarcina]|uniref:response regulator transcription factor n=1 Tax=Sporosarcina TaxID=1569 RepID=UPI00058CE4E7|nr:MULTISPECIES: response regulator transcription factor [Sporosarcina]WJY28964.1 response regulator transcription factor [Sporosarcina sp. 0.2-SM1T-5]
MNRVLIVEDEPSIAALLKYNLEQSGFLADVTHDGQSAVTMAAENRPDLIILDIMLPEMDGMEVCKTLRQEKIQTPILMLTAKSEEFDKILALELGADDYLTKPFSPREVVARVKAIIRRSRLTVPEPEPQQDKPFRIGELIIYPERIEAQFSGKPLDLTPKEFELLLYLARHSGKVLNREQLLDKVWNYEYTGDSRIVDVHISHLREKIERDSRKPMYIKTVRGFGYKLERISD